MRQSTLFDVEPEPTADDGLPPLTGSDKQRGWALKIRTELIAGVRLLIRQQRLLAEAHHAADRWSQCAFANAVLTRMVKAAGRLERETYAGWWIDRKDLTPEQLLRGVNPQDVEGIEDCGGEGVSDR